MSYPAPKWSRSERLDYFRHERKLYVSMALASVLLIPPATVGVNYGIRALDDQSPSRPVSIEPAIRIAINQAVARQIVQATEDEVAKAKKSQNGSYTFNIQAQGTVDLAAIRKEAGARAAKDPHPVRSSFLMGVFLAAMGVVVAGAPALTYHARVRRLEKDAPKP